MYPAEGVVAGDEAVLFAHFGWDRVGEASLLGSLQHFFYALVDFASVYGILLGLSRLAIQGHNFAYLVADGVYQRVCHAGRAAEPFDLAEEVHLHAFAELLRSPRLVEEGALELARAVVYLNSASAFGAAPLPLPSAEILLRYDAGDFS